MATTQRDFEAVARIIDGSWEKAPLESEDLLVEISEKLADYFESQNERFDRERFMKACGIETVD